MTNSKWIWISEETRLNEYVEFLTTLDYKNGVCAIKISVDTEYALYINGEYVTSGQYADFPWYKVHDRIDVTDRVKAGKNEIRIVGWYMGDRNFCHYINRPGLRFEILVDGVTQVSSSEDTLCRPYPCLASGDEVKKINNQLGKSFLWQSSCGEDFRPAVAVSGMPETTVERPIKNLRILDRLPAKSVGKSVFDLGAETVGYPYLEIKAPEGERVNVAFGEWLNDEGQVARFIAHYDFSFEVLGNGEVQKLFNPLRKLGCRYFEVSGNCEIREIGLYPVQYPFDIKEVEIQGQRERAIYDISVRTLLLNAFEHYYDCPWREQAFWTFDARFQMRYGYSAFRGFEYQRAALALLSEDRREDGLITMVVPSSTPNTIPSFALSYVMAMAEYIEASGDRSLAEKYFTKVKSVIDTYLGRMIAGLVPCFEGIWNFYEWKPNFDGKCTRDVDAVLNLFVCYALDKLVYICRQVGKTSDAEYYSDRLSDLIMNVRNRFFEEERGLFRSFDDEPVYSQLVNSLAILSGAVDGEEARRICEILVCCPDWVTETTLSMTAFKYDALMQVDKSKYKDFIIRHINETVGSMIDRGATSLWETVLGKDDMEGSGSLCHGWSALPVYYYRELSVLRDK